MSPLWHNMTHMHTHNFFSYLVLFYTNGVIFYLTTCFLLLSLSNPSQRTTEDKHYNIIINNIIDLTPTFSVYWTYCLDLSSPSVCLVFSLLSSLCYILHNYPTLRYINLCLYLYFMFSVCIKTSLFHLKRCYLVIFQTSFFIHNVILFWQHKIFLLIV